LLPVVFHKRPRNQREATNAVSVDLDAIQEAKSMATLSEKQAKLFTDRNWGVIATIREDGSPQATPVWIDYDGENVLVNSARGRTKVTNIERDPRATVTVLPAEDQQSGYVMVSGAAKIVDEGALEHNMLARKYLGQDKYPYLGPGEQRVIIEIHPERIDGFGAGG
jgi:PPOX class probable F420-dependent enzyme